MEKDLQCVICGKIKTNPYYPLCMDCSPYIYKKGSLPHQKVRRRKKWTENRAKLIEKAGNRCEWCQSEKPPFSIHHPNEINARTYDHIWNTIVSDHVDKLLEKNPNLRESITLHAELEKRKTLNQKLKKFENKAKESQVKICPYCSSSNITRRTTRTPMYRCSACKNEFDDPKERPYGNLQKSIETMKSKLKFQDYSYIHISPNQQFGSIYPLIYENAKLDYNNYIEQLISYYEEMVDAIVLCKKCHSAARLGLKLCERCKKKYRKETNEFCYSCYCEVKGINIEKDHKSSLWYLDDDEDWDEDDPDDDEDW